MKGELSLHMTGGILLTLVGLAAGSALLVGMRDTGTPDTGFEPGETSCGQYTGNVSLDWQEFRSLVSLKAEDRCGTEEQWVETEFTLTNESLERFLREWGLTDSDGQPYILYRSSCEFPGSGFPGVVYGSSEGKVLNREGNSVKLVSAHPGVVICPG